MRTRWLLVGSGAALVALLVAWPAVAPGLRQAALDLYRLSGTLNGTLAGPISALRFQTGASLLTPFLLGLLAATAPCQLSTGAATLAYVARDGHAGGAWPRSLAFVLARLLVYLVLGAVAVYVFGGSVTASGPFFTGVRRVLGPLMFLVGLVMVGVLRPRFTVGARLAERLEERARVRRGTLGAFALGLAFSFAFCPTLFLLYFGLTLPLALTAPLGALYPAAFVLGMMLPLLVLVAFLPAASASGRQTYIGGLRRVHRLATPLAGAVFVLAGLYDTFIYWLL
ncbi:MULTISPECIES: sulfite exporter TauE/SafE family protein [Deinococcus]|uniref:urease accessory protein UreH domain-containing protein n=1 Tax=Deinococcus TaxID=1298 RepID=UPI001F480464|nr:sulfite exporter TauE/SafE family protein [Deinococcus phoenicis]